MDGSTELGIKNYNPLSTAFQIRTVSYIQLGEFQDLLAKIFVERGLALKIEAALSVLLFGVSYWLDSSMPLPQRVAFAISLFLIAGIITILTQGQRKKRALSAPIRDKRKAYKLRQPDYTLDSTLNYSNAEVPATKRSGPRRLVAGLTAEQMKNFLAESGATKDRMWHINDTIDIAIPISVNGKMIITSYDAGDIMNNPAAGFGVLRITVYTSSGEIATSNNIPVKDIYCYRDLKNSGQGRIRVAHGFQVPDTYTFTPTYEVNDENGHLDWKIQGPTSLRVIPVQPNA